MEHIEKAFKEIGSRVKIGDVSERQARFRRIRNSASGRDVSLIDDIQTDHKGEFFPTGKLKPGLSKTWPFWINI